MNKQYDLAVYIGRFQPFHNGHLSVINKAEKLADKVLVLVGSANASPSIRNPFTYDERWEMIDRTYAGAKWLNIKPLNDNTGLGIGEDIIYKS